MEDILLVYTRPYDPRYPLVCMDESTKQLIEEVHPPIPAEPGRVARHDSEYKRNGVANLFLFYEPLAGERHVAVTEHRTQKDWARQVKILLDEYYPNAQKVRLVMDNLNTHTGASLYEAFEPQEARRLLDRLEIHYTPKHGSWLNMAEPEFSVLSSQCLDRRIPDRETLAREIAAWETRRYASRAGSDWRFTAQDARIKLKNLYPTLSA